MRGAGRLAAVAGICAGLAACSATTREAAVEREADINEETKFSAAEYGVPASERVTTSKVVPKGGGRSMVGAPYQVRGKWYTPKEDPDYNKTGLASWYGPNFHGRSTANGEIYDQYHLSAAHPTFPLPSYARVTNEDSGHSVVVRVNDRGPFTGGRIIDVSRKTAEVLDFKHRGVARVNVQYIGPAPIDGQDMPFLMASYRPSGDRAPNVAPEGQIASGVMLAMNETVPGVASDAYRVHGLSGPTARPEAAANDTASQAAAAAADEAVPAAATPEQAAILPEAPLEAVESNAQAGDGTLLPGLPEIGPVPPDRPSMLTAGSDAPVFHSAYAGERLDTAYAAFDAVLDDRDSLSVADILASWERRSGARD